MKRNIMETTILWFFILGPIVIGIASGVYYGESKLIGIWIGFFGCVLLLVSGALQWHQFILKSNPLDIPPSAALGERPWLEVTPEIFQGIHFSTFFDHPHVFIPIRCNIVNSGGSPARNVIFNIRIDSVPNMDNKFWADSDARLDTLCKDTAEFSKKNPQSGIPIFNKMNPVHISQGAENIDERYFTMESTIYIVQGCVDYTYSADEHGQTTFRYLVGKFGADKTLHGIPFIKGQRKEGAPGNLHTAFLDVKKFDFVKTDGGNYAK